jgi:hypothetical protein
MSDKDKLTPKVLLENLYDILKNNGEILNEGDFGGGEYPQVPRYAVGDLVLVKHYQGVGKIAYIKHREDVGVIIKEPSLQHIVTTIDDLRPYKHNKVKAECGEPDQMTDEELKMFSRHNVGKRSGRGQGDNPWNHLKSRGRNFKGRTRNEDVDVEECAGVGIITNQNSTKDVNKKTPQKNLDAFHLEEALFDMYNTLTEGGTHPLGDAAKASIKGAITTPDANNNAGDAYKSWRFGIALAGAPEYPTKAVNDIGGDPLITTYTDEERKMVQYAAQQADVGHLKNLTSNKSAEKPDVNKLSAISPAKRNKYGI